MLQKEFFQVQPFNPNPYWDPVIVNLSGAQKFEEDTIFKPGRYRIEMQAGSARSQLVNGYTDIGFGGKIVQDITVEQDFIIRAYCGSKSSGTINFDGQVGINPYNGVFKINGVWAAQNVSAVNNIFGNAGSSGLYYNQISCSSSGNCLGDGGGDTAAAGSCLHLLPVGGIFGTDYLYAFHTTGGVAGVLATGGTGGAYGGGAGGTSYSGTAYSGGSTPYGNGGSANTGGSDGSGIGHGKKQKSGTTAADGAAAWFDGTNWNQSDMVASGYLDGKIFIKYIGPLYV